MSFAWGMESVALRASCFDLKEFALRVFSGCFSSGFSLLAGPVISFGLVFGVHRIYKSIALKVRRLLKLLKSLAFLLNLLASKRNAYLM
jgi:hypothetical protein